MLHTGDIVYVDAATLVGRSAVAAYRLRRRRSGGHVVADGESYWSISEAHLPTELGREPTPREVLERTEAAIAYNAPRLGYDDPKMLHTGDVVYVDAVTLSLARRHRNPHRRPPIGRVPVVTESPAAEVASPPPPATTTPPAPAGRRPRRAAPPRRERPDQRLPVRGARARGDRVDVDDVAGVDVFGSS